MENAGLELSGTGNVWNATCGITYSDSDDTGDADSDSVPTASGDVAPSAAVQPPDLCEVCLVEQRDARHALVACDFK